MSAAQAVSWPHGEDWRMKSVSRAAMAGQPHYVNRQDGSVSGAGGLMAAQREPVNDVRQPRGMAKQPLFFNRQDGSVSGAGGLIVAQQRPAGQAAFRPHGEKQRHNG